MVAWPLCADVGEIEAAKDKRRVGRVEIFILWQARLRVGFRVAGNSSKRIIL